MKKKILGMLIAVMMIGTVAGCGNTENADAPTTTDTVPETEVETETNDETVEVADTTEDAEVVAENVDLGGKEPDQSLCSSIKYACQYTIMDPVIGTTEGAIPYETELSFSFNGNILTITPEVDDAFKQTIEANLNMKNWSKESFYSGDVIVVITDRGNKITVTYGDIVVE